MPIGSCYISVELKLHNMRRKQSEGVERLRVLRSLQSGNRRDSVQLAATLVGRLLSFFYIGFVEHLQILSRDTANPDL